MEKLKTGMINIKSVKISHEDIRAFQNIFENAKSRGQVVYYTKSREINFMEHHSKYLILHHYAIVPIGYEAIVNKNKLELVLE